MTPNARSAYMDASVATASPARLLGMLYERLVLDLTRGLEAQRTGAVQDAHRALLHAQDIVLELHASLKVDSDWEGGAGLASLYDYLHRQLVRANISKDSSITESCLALASDLCAVWREAAMQSAGAA